MTLEEYKTAINLKADDLEKSGAVAEYDGLMYAVLLAHELDPIPESQHGCFTCLAQGCRFRTTEVRVNCPLWKESAV